MSGTVIPAQAGIQEVLPRRDLLDSHVRVRSSRGNDGVLNTRLDGRDGVRA